MDVYKAIMSRRSIRRFKQKKVTLDQLKKLVNAARLAPSAANLQPLEYIIINKEDLCSKVFETLGWAAYIKPTWKPSSEERPTAYIIILVMDPNNKYYTRDASLSSENIVLAAEGKGLGSCILYNVDREKLRVIFRIPKDVIIDTVIALGYKAEKSVAEELKESVKYWRDENQVLHVPKRKLEDIIHENEY